MRAGDVAVWGADPGGRGWEGVFLSVLWAGGGEGSGGALFLGQSGGPPLWVSPLGVPFAGFEGFGICALMRARLRTFCSWHFEYGIGTRFPIVEHYVYVHG